MKAIVIGCGRVGSNVAKALQRDGWDVTVVDEKEEALEWEADLIILGSSPRWRRQSRFFSPTVDYVLRHAPTEVMVIAYPQGVLEEDVEVSSVS